MAQTGDAGFSEGDLEAATTPAVFARGADYVRYVRALRVTPGQARASVQAKRVYTVEFTWDGDRVAGDCTCPYAADRSFCKHLVAVGLAVLDHHNPNHSTVSAEGADSVQAYLSHLSHDELRSLVQELAVLSDSGQRLLATRAATATGDSDQIAAGFLASARQALSIRGFVDYRRSFEVANDADTWLDEVERHLDGSPEAADGARSALEYAVKRLRTITLRADDSGGSIGGACQRAADLHSRSCLEGRPDPSKLARWLITFRTTSPGWPETPLEGYAAALDDKALTMYRRGVEKYAAQDQDDRWSSFAAIQMQLELADHDEDVDRAVEILSQGEHPAYGSIIDRLRAVGRTREAAAWNDRAIQAGRLSDRPGNQYWLYVPDVLAALLADGREEDALELARSRFSSSPTVTSYGHLLDLADQLQVREAQQRWAIGLADERCQRRGNADLLVSLHLDQDEVDEAWQAHERYGVSSLWERLANAVAATRPREAADLYRPDLARVLLVTDRRNYETAAEYLTTMRALYAQVGAEREIDALVDDLKDQYRRRPSFLAELARRQLTGLTGD
ncbi:SWIM zinc finger family protein [Ornithinimicrobium sp. Y1847]|uniref:SWIM zinc finger family protein n=1 Tax=Ornithinimicrobium sp. Y1847 TaxID=3405419 RepID=UPI003B681399